MRSDVAASAPGPGGGSSPGSADTLRPTPMTIASPVASARIPPSFAGPASTSFGHFSRAWTPVMAVTAEATATPVSSGSQPRRAGGTTARPHQQGERQRGAWRRHPGAAHPAASRALLLGGEHHAFRRAGEGPGQQVGVGRAGAVYYLHGLPQAARPSTARARLAASRGFGDPGAAG